MHVLISAESIFNKVQFANLGINFDCSNEAELLQHSMEDCKHLWMSPELMSTGCA